MVSWLWYFGRGRPQCGQNKAPEGLFTDWLPAWMDGLFISSSRGCWYGVGQLHSVTHPAVQYIEQPVILADENKSTHSAPSGRRFIDPYCRWLTGWLAAWWWRYSGALHTHRTVNLSASLAGRWSTTRRTTPSFVNEINVNPWPCNMDSKFQLL